MRGDESVVAVTPLGSLRGAREGKLAVFRGVRFAEPPRGELRFSPPRAIQAWEGTLSAIHNGPQPPQLASASSESNEFDEDCLSVTIWTPAPDQRRRPVMFWIFGGGFMVGSCSSPLYDGASLAEHDVVVVGINYRLGVLGYLELPGVSPGNLGLLDQLMALKWVRSNIHAFGGDPENITVVGQSAGALSAAYVLCIPEARGMARRLILQSPAFDTGLPTRDENSEAASYLLKELGLERSTPRLREKMLATQVSELLAAQQRIAARTWRGREGLVRRPFFPSLVPPLDFGRRHVLDVLADAIVGDRLDLLLGTTCDDAAHFYASDPEVWEMNDTALLRRIAAVLPGNPKDRLDHIRAIKPSASPSECLVDLVTDFQLRLSALRLADEVSGRGVRTYVYRFDWCGADAPLGASHCAELPFIFGTPSHWNGWPFLRGADNDELLRMVRIMQEAWVEFLRHGDPNGSTRAHWPRYSPAERTVMSLDLESQAKPADPPYYTE